MNLRKYGLAKIESQRIQNFDSNSILIPRSGSECLEFNSTVCNFSEGSLVVISSAIKYS